MKFIPRRPRTNKRGNAKLQGRHRLRRLNTIETLEGRVLLAGDTGVAVAPLQNALNPRDVNFDQRVSPIDALLVINALTAQGSHSVPAGTVSPLTAGSNQPSKFLDVNGDNRVSPIDALQVINLLATSKLMQISTFPTDLNGNPISSINVGSNYLIQTWVQDIRNPPDPVQGVFSAYTNVNYNSSLSSVNPGQTVTYGEFFNLLRNANLSTPGLIGAAGSATGSLVPPATGNAPQFLWSVVATATSTGLQNFTPSFDATHEALLYNFNRELTADEIEFVGSTLQIVGGPSLSVGDVSIVEGNSGSKSLVFNVALSVAAQAPVTVRYSTLDGTATVADNDYVATSGTLTFAPGVTSQLVTVQITGDTKFESDETFNLVLSSPVNAELGVSVGTGTIINDDDQSLLSIGNVSLNEGNSGTTPFVFTVSLAPVATQTVTVQYTTENGTANAGSDYTPTNGTLTFAPGESTKLITVQVTGDTNVEANETFNVVLSNATNTGLGTSTALGTIVNDDIQASISISDAQVTAPAAPGTVNAVFTVSLAAPISNQVTVQYATANQTATAPGDYTATSGTLTFAPGVTSQLITVTVQGDSAAEPTETFVVNLSNPVNGAITDNQGLGTILPAVVTPSVSINNVQLTEGNSGTKPFVFTLTQSSATSQNAVVAWQTANGTATAPSDYTAASGTITFTPGTTARTITVQVVGDTNVEQNETFSVNVTPVQNVTGSVTGVGTIINDDGAPMITVDDATIVANSSTPVNGVFTVRISGQVSQQVTVGYATADNSAQANIDYLPISGILTFTPGGPLFQTVTVSVLPSGLPEDDETFFLNLSSVSGGGAVISDAQAIGTIVRQGITVSDVSQAEGNSGLTPFVFSVSLSRASDVPVTVQFATADGTATLGNFDYQPTSGTLTFAPGETTKLVTVNVVGDGTQEPNETFRLNLSNAVGSQIFIPSATGTILNDDGARVIIRADVVNAGGTPLSGPLNIGDEFFLQIMVEDVQAVQSGIFQAYVDAMFDPSLVKVDGPITYGAAYPNDRMGDLNSPGLVNNVGGFGNLSQPNPLSPQILVRIPFEAIGFGLAQFNIGPANSNDPNDLPVLVYLDDNPVPPAQVNFVGDSINIGSDVFSVNNVSVNEGNSGLTNMVFTVTRFLPTNTQATVEYFTTNGTALAGLDYIAKSGTLTFAPGVTTQTVTISVVGDTLDEDNETFSLGLRNATGGATASATAGIGTITDDDNPASVSVSGGNASEGGNVNFTVSLSAPSGKTVTVVYTTADSQSGNPATAGLDYVPTSGTLTFAPGQTQQTVAVQTLSDILLEQSENFRLVLSNPSNANLGTAQATGTIFDVAPAGISGYVYVDQNNDGIKSAQESGIANVTITAYREGTNFSVSTTTDENGFYRFLGLVPGTYTLVETQPGFFNDGRDTINGVDSPFNDRFSGISLAASQAAGGFNFGERGLRAEFMTAFLNRRAFFASAETGNPIGAMGTVSPKGGDIWISFDAGWSGLRTIEAHFDSSLGSASMKLYNNNLQEVALSLPTAFGAQLLYNGTTGSPYFLRISGSNPSVSLSTHDADPQAISFGLTVSQQSTDSGASNPSPSTSTPTQTTSSTNLLLGRFSSAPAPSPQVAEPLAASEASDDLWTEEEDWLTEALLA